MRTAYSIYLLSKIVHDSDDRENYFKIQIREINMEIMSVKKKEIKIKTR